MSLGTDFKEKQFLRHFKNSNFIKCILELNNSTLYSFFYFRSIFIIIALLLFLLFAFLMSSPLTGRRIRLNKLKIIISEKKVIKISNIRYYGTHTISIHNGPHTISIHNGTHTISIPIKPQLQSNFYCDQTCCNL